MYNMHSSSLLQLTQRYGSHTKLATQLLC